MKSQEASSTLENKISNLIFDDNPILREGLKSVLSHSSVFDIVEEPPR